MAGQRNKNAFKFLLILLILSQKHILGVKKVVWDGLDVVWGGLEVVWGGLGCFGVVWGVSTDPPAPTPPTRNRDSSPTRQFTDKHFEDSSRTEMNTVKVIPKGKIFGSARIRTRTPARQSTTNHVAKELTQQQGC